MSDFGRRAASSWALPRISTYNCCIVMKGVAELLGSQSPTVIKSYTTVVSVKPRDLVAVISERKCGNSLLVRCVRN